MPDQESKHFSLDDRITSYQPFFDHNWAKDIDEASNGAKKLSSLIFDLMVSWKALSRTFSLPSIAVTVAESYARGHGLNRLENSTTIKIIDHITARLEQRITFTGVQRGDLKRAMLDIMDEFHEKVAGVPEVPFPSQDLWDGLVKIEKDEPEHTPKGEMRLAIWACVQICYSGLFFSYEAFFVRALQKKAGQRITSSDRDFAKKCDDLVGTTLAEYCWRHPQIFTARNVRHSLVHAGGKMTDNLTKCKQHLDIDVVDDALQILPADVHKLFAVLRPRVDEIVKWAAPLSEFS